MKHPQKKKKINKLCSQNYIHDIIKIKEENPPYLLPKYQVSFLFWKTRQQSFALVQEILEMFLIL